MQLLESSIEEKMIQQEQLNMPNNLSRLVLEESVYQQFAVIASCLLAYALLTNMRSEVDIKYYDQLLDNIEFRYTPPSRSTALIDLVVAGSIKPLSPNDLSKIKIRIFKKEVPLFESDEINRQLMLLGSSMRVFIFSGEHMLVNCVKEYLNIDTFPGSVDARFIIGYINWFSGTPFGQTYHFKKELCVSPFLSGHEPGFCIKDKIVIREELAIKTAGENAINHVFTHELLHQTTYALKANLPYGRFFWRDDLNMDILRFLSVPRSRDDIYQCFRDSYHNRLWEEYLLKYLPELYPHINYKEFVLDMDELLDSLIDKKLIVTNANGLLSSEYMLSAQGWYLI